jgi:hypothetical protein
MLGHGSKIVRDGLVLHLDAANIKSYPGSGTLWKDVSGNGNNGTLVNGVAFNSSNKGSMFFDRVNDHINFENVASLQFLNRSPYTLEAWIYPTVNPGASSWTGIFNRESTFNGLRDGYNIYLNGSTGTAMFFATERFQAGTNRGLIYEVTTSVLNTWQQVCATYDGTNLNLFYNAQLISTRDDATGNIANTSKALEIGRRSSGSYFGGRLNEQKIYNRALAPAEIQQNFEAIRGRYGI